MNRSAVLSQSGAISVSSTDEQQPLEPGQVRIAVSRAGLNYWEVMQRLGRVPRPPHDVPGTEGCGLVLEAAEAPNEGASNGNALVPGDRVAWFRNPGSFATELIAPAASCYKVPDSVSDETAAGLLFQGATANYLASDTWPLPAGTEALVTAAAGGVGHLLVQLLAQRGVAVTAIVSSAAKAATLESLGVAQTLTYEAAEEDPSLERRFSAVFDSLAGAYARNFLRWLKPRGCIAIYGAASGSDAEIVPADLGAGSFFLTRTAGRDYSSDPVAGARHAKTLLEGASSGALRVHIGATYGLDQTADALDALASRSTTGKILIDPRQ